MVATITPVPTLAAETAPLEVVTEDLYRDIHKAIRTELFAVTDATGTVDPADDEALGAVVARWATLAGLLTTHAMHEDDFVRPVVDAVDRELAETVGDEHEAIEQTMGALRAIAARASAARGDARRRETHRLYLGLSSFTATYLRHEELEELVVMPALASKVPVEELQSVHQAILASIPPDEMAMSLSLMLPAMNVDERVELLGGVRAGAPAEVFAGVLALAQSVLRPEVYAQTAQRLGAECPPVRYEA